MLEIGMKAPEFCLPNQDETEICLRDLKGKWIVLYFYPKDLTPGCTTEACEFTALNPTFDDLGAVVIGVSADSPQKHRDFIAKKELDLMLLSDESTDMLSRYGVWRMKKMCGKEYMGIVRSTIIINPKGEIAAVFDNVKANGHAAKIKEALEKLQK